MSEDICALEAFTLRDQLFLIFGMAYCTVNLFSTLLSVHNSFKVLLSLMRGNAEYFSPLGGLNSSGELS